MSQFSRIYCLPVLHHALTETTLRPLPVVAVRVWPGLPNMPDTGYWAAPNYPFDAAAAQDCMQQLEALSEAALSGVPMQTLASMDSASDTKKRRQELDDIATFARSGGVTAPAEPEALKVLQAAQKSLLWAWLLEEKVLEVKNIMGNYAHNAPHLMDALGVEDEDDDKALSLLASLNSTLDSTSLMLPPWSMVLENASLFLPEEACIAVDATMADELQDRLTFAPASEHLRTCWGLETAAHADDALLAVRAPLWQALGKSEDAATHPWRSKHFTFVLPVTIAQRGRA